MILATELERSLGVKRPDRRPVRQYTVFLKEGGGWIVERGVVDKQRPGTIACRQVLAESARDAVQATALDLGEPLPAGDRSDR